MPQIQYSEKYYDDVFEYRCVAGERRGRGALKPGAAVALGLGCRSRPAAPGRAPRRAGPRAAARTRLTAAPRRSHVVLPPDIAKLLPKNRLLSEVRRRWPRLRERRALLRRRRAPRAVLACRAAARRVRAAARALPDPPDVRPECKRPSCSQAEWRGMGVQQSRGWVHYAIHRPEPHIMLYRCASRAAPGRASQAAGPRRRALTPLAPPPPRAGGR
jgi:hypothetical protein